MTFVLSSIAGLTLLPGAAHGQDAFTNDWVFLTTPEGGICVPAEFLQHVTMQIVLACPSSPFIRGFELGLEIDNQHDSTLSAYIPGIPSLEFPPPSVPGFWDMIANYGCPLPAADDFVLVEVDIFYLDTGPLYFHLTGSTPSSVGGEVPAYLAEPGMVVLPMTPIPTGEDWDFAVNDTEGCAIVLSKANWTCVPLPNTTMSWGAVKSLYRYPPTGATGRGSAPRN